MKRKSRHGLLQCKSGGTPLKESDKHYTTLLKESLHLQEGLRRVAHRELRAQEQARLTLSHQLQDEIAQTLLGINVRLLSLKTVARDGANDLTKEIASTQRLVAESIRSINQFAHELVIHHPA